MAEVPTAREQQREAYERGVTTGEISARLAGHDKHFAVINGSLEKIANELRDLNLAMQRLGDQAVSRDDALITTAAALKDAEAIRRRRVEQHWSPLTRVSVALSAVAAAAAIWFAIYSALHQK